MVWSVGETINANDPAWAGIPASLDGEIYLGGDLDSGIETRGVVTLDDAKTAKRSDVRAAAKAAIESGISSSVLGSVHTYPTTAQDQNNLAGLVQQANIDGAGAKFWCADSGGVWARRQHTAAQLIQLGRDVIEHVQANQDIYEERLRQIEVAVTVEDVEAVSW